MAGTMSEVCDAYWMKLALVEARRAFALGEVPVGAVAVGESGELLGVAHNQRESKQDVFAHAECCLLRKLQQAFGSWRLPPCHLYVTLEPCAMCAGAIVQARVKRLVYGADNYRDGCFGSVALFPELFSGACHTEVVSGVEKVECQKVLKDFFKRRR